MLGERLKIVREMRGLSQQDLADRVGTTAKQVWRYENSENTPAADVLARLAQELEVTTDYLVGLASVPTANAREDELSPVERKFFYAIRHGTAAQAAEAFAELMREKENIYYRNTS